LFLPTLFCIKSAGPLESILIAIIRIKKTGDNTISPSKERQISINLLNFKYAMIPSLSLN
jgi:hypothetical protein